jgi:hypothetical protein
MCECQVEVFLSFVLLKKNWRFFFFWKLSTFFKIRHFHKNTTIWLSVTFLNLFFPNWLSTYNISTRATLWEPFLTMSRVVIKAQNIFLSIPHHLGFYNNHVQWSEGLVIIIDVYISPKGY